MNNQIDTIKNLLTEIKNTKNNGNKGEEFENQIKSILSRNHFTEQSLNEKDTLSFYKMIKNNLSIKEYKNIIKNLKKEILDKNSVQIIKNPFKKYIPNNIYIYIYINHLVHKISQISY